MSSAPVAAAPATAAAPAPAATSATVWVGGGIFFCIAAIALMGVSSGMISNSLQSVSQWSSIKGSVTTYTVITAAGVACMAVGWLFFMLEYPAHAHIMLAMMAALAFGIASTVLAVTTIALR